MRTSTQHSNKKGDTFWPQGIEKEDFSALLEEQVSSAKSLEGTVVKGVVVSIDGDSVVVDVGLKSEGRIPLKEFGALDQSATLKPGSQIEVFIDRFENREGEAVLSRERARREEVWVELEEKFNRKEPVTGTIFNRVKGGFTVDVEGAIAFLPASQVDIRPVRDVSALMNTPQPFQILKMDRKRGNIIVSRRAIMEESREEARQELMVGMREGIVLEGIVKNITDYGAFIDLGGVDGLLHLTDMSWKRVAHPTELVSLGQTIKVQVIKYNDETKRVSLGMKQLETDPWREAVKKYSLGMKVKGRITNVTDYGAFIELEQGVEGLVHVSEMSWTRSSTPPSKIVSVGQEIDVMVLEVDPEKRRISLGMKQCTESPWTKFSEQYPAGTVIRGTVKNITDFGLFLDLPQGLDGMVHISDLSWDQSPDQSIKAFEKGQEIDVKILDIDAAKARISLGIKQLSAAPQGGTALSKAQRSGRVTCTIKSVSDKGLDVDVNGAAGFIRRSDLSRDKSEQRPDRFAVGEKVDALVLKTDKASHKMQLSIKALEIADEREAMAEYGSADSGAQLGDILGGALAEAKKKSSAKAAAAAKKAKSDDDASNEEAQGE